MNTSKSDNWQHKMKANTLKLAYWTGAWLLTLALATFGPMLLWQNDSLSLIATAVNLCVGIGVLIANRDQLRSLDELQQKIQLEAMSLTLGVAVIVSMAYTTLDPQYLLNIKDSISRLMFVIGITYSIGILLGRRKYK